MARAIRLLVIAAMAGALTACNRQPGDSQDAVPKEPTTLETAVDGFTGRTATRAGLKARDDIERISANHDREIEEVMQ